MVEIAWENATTAGVAVDFRRGDATAVPFADESFDLIACQAAFKNFQAARERFSTRCTAFFRRAGRL